MEEPDRRSGDRRALRRLRISAGAEPDDDGHGGDDPRRGGAGRGADAAGAWRVVADSNDRAKVASTFSAEGLSAGEAKEAARLMEEKKSAEEKMRGATQNNH